MYHMVAWVALVAEVVAIGVGKTVQVVAWVEELVCLRQYSLDAKVMAEE